MFHLGKWYLDLVTPDGTTVICYAARLRWGPASFRYASILVDAPGEKQEEGITVRRVERPAVDRDVIRWRSPTLDVTGEWRRKQPAVRQTLIRSPAGAIRWSCRMPLASANVAWGARRFTGLGYVEWLGMTISPTRLPFRTLRWGRHLSPEHSLVWIDWRGEAARQWVWLDGVRQQGATFREDGMIEVTDGPRLSISGSRDIRNRLVLPAIGSALSRLVSRRAGSLGTLREHKMVAHSSLLDEGSALDSGWTVHEVVTW